MSYDLIVIGGGPGGYHGALKASEAGLNTLLIEKKKVGGVCLNEGCIPSKTFLYSAKNLRAVSHFDRLGISVSDIHFSHKKVVDRKNEITKLLGDGIHSRLKGKGVVYKNGEAKILKREQDGFLVEVNGEEISGKRLLLALGANPVIPPIKGIENARDQGVVLTSKEILDITEIPETLTIIGGGVIGLEMADYFSSTGSKVTVIEMEKNIGGSIDIELSKTLQAILEKRGVIFELNARVLELNGNSVIYATETEQKELKSQHVLVCTGRKPNIENVGLDKLGIEIINGAIATDVTCRTNIPNVFAVGDVNGKSMLAHTAYREAEVSVNNMIGKKDKVRYGTVPNVIYTSPEVSSVGETEESATTNGIDYEKVKIPLSYSGRHIVEVGYPEAFVKVLVDKEYKRIIGLHMLGDASSEIIYGATLMVETEMVASDIKELVFPHPSIAEIIKEAIDLF